ncbi:MAG TPA: hydroxyacid dehydrogenase [Chloroflexia bacterium]|nr:hydroxyacid dehydrogenase [Chloroflexia bacterium]
MAFTILVSEFMDEVGLALLRGQPGLHLVYQPELFKDRAGLLSAVAGCQGLIVRNQTQVNLELVEAAPQLMVVGRLGVGLDNIAQPVLKERNIKLVVPVGANATAVAEWTTGAMLALARRFVPASLSVAKGEWKRTLFGGEELAGKTLGLIGFGDIARRVARRALSFEMTLATFDPYLPPSILAEWGTQVTLFDKLEDLLERSNFVSLHVPLTDETHYLLNKSRLELLPQGAFVINSARGGLVEESALLELLQQGKLGGVALDVREQEPPDRADPLNRPDLNVLLTPHVAGLTGEAQHRVSLEVAQGLARALNS